MLNKSTRFLTLWCKDKLTSQHVVSNNHYHILPDGIFHPLPTLRSLPTPHSTIAIVTTTIVTTTTTITISIDRSIRRSRRVGSFVLTKKTAISLEDRSSLIVTPPRASAKLGWKNTVPLFSTPPKSTIPHHRMPLINTRYRSGNFKYLWKKTNPSLRLKRVLTNFGEWNIPGISLEI